MPRVLTRPRAALALALVLAAGAAATPGGAGASDHADPIDPFRRSDEPERGLTGLFVFPVYDGKRTKGGSEKDLSKAQDEKLVLIVGANRLRATPPYRGLDAFEFVINVDSARSAKINYPKELARPTSADERNTARYGGVVDHPEAIRPTFRITMKLKNSLEPFTDQNFLSRKVEADRGNGLQEVPLSTVTRWGAGVRDDPFIFPAFFGTNVIAMAVEVPYSAFPRTPGTDSLLVWATRSRNGAQVGHVGRAQRAQLPRFDLLNTIPPSEHVKAIREAREKPGVRTDALRYLFPAEFNLRSFDDQPDVAIFTRRHPPGFPNGRRLEDDVAKLTCEQGDCQLYELSFVPPRSPKVQEAAKYDAGRPTANDRPFLDEWPYLAEAQEEPMPVPVADLTTRTRIVFVAIALIVLAVFLFPLVLLYRSKRQLRRLRQAVTLAVAPPTPPPGAPGGASS
ncbi:hypothetical protein GobsT_07670 [Gemmata obscuriglobus]|uniref:DUF2330 domain-containing protein n=1 Tax=Gemmata obscuriglobus TaxID=114 RepID=A0A2Z3H792_9BACT|nr:hypothetical protein [Gemmata obscuriglobus]AWM40701.1 hypothetical protein C1280_29425 [Gemmata obscuriglobus]QEG26032.1 hypothetical protein GobsT_07670 [Gemmata obscuriglobus]VTS00379.1 Putative uncharacterized protein OS=Methylocapsa acidiphila GN=orf30 PE=4 SV=1: DUF4331 [Gemmata obscuriglobus UQM 2246]